MLNLLLVAASVFCLTASAFMLLIMVKFIAEFKSRTKRNRNIREVVARAQDEKLREEIKKKVEEKKREKEAAKS